MVKAKQVGKGTRKGRSAAKASVQELRITDVPSRSVNTALLQTTIKVQKQRQKWIPKYEAELGLRPLHSGAQGEVTEAWCKFCESFGRENAQSGEQTHFTSLFRQKQRKKTSNIQAFSAFRRDNIINHLIKQHPTKWEAFSSLAAHDERRVTIFQKVPISGHFAKDGNTSHFVVPRAIMRLIHRLLSNVGDELVLNDDFVLVDAEIGRVIIANDFMERVDGDYDLTIHDRLQFETALRCINTSTSFRAVTRIFVIFGEAFGSMKLGKPSKETVGKFVRYVVAINLTAIDSILSSGWAFSILVDGATHMAAGYLDVQVSFKVARAAYNFNLFAIPMGNRAHTASNYADFVLDTLECVGGDVILRELIGISSDGAATMQGCRQGFAV